MSAAEPVVRAAELRDAEAMGRLHVAAWRATYRGHFPDALLDGLEPEKSAAKWRRVIAEGTVAVLVAERDGRVAGFCTLVRSRDADEAANVLEMTTLYVDPSEWRAGLGRALAQAALRSARSRGFDELSLWVLTANDNARAFYGAQGFAPDGHVKTTELLGHPVHETRYRRAAP